MILFDTGPIVAAANAAEARHAQCRALLGDRHGPRLIAPLVLAEVCYLLEKKAGTKQEAAFLTGVAAGAFEVAALDTADFERMAELVLRYEDLPLGAADASVIAVAERLGLTTVATLDRRHFSVVRPAHADHFTLVP